MRSGAAAPCAAFSHLRGVIGDRIFREENAGGQRFKVGDNTTSVALSWCRPMNDRFFITCTATGNASALIALLGLMLIRVILNAMPRRTSADSYLNALAEMPYRQANGH